MLNRVLAAITAIAAALAVFFGLRSKQRKAEAERDRQRAEVAESAEQARQRIDQARTGVQKKHRSEQEASDARLAAGQRDHFEERW